MRYLLEDRGDYFGVLNEASDTYVAYVHPQKIRLHAARYRVVNREGNEITVVGSLDEALAGFVAHLSAHPPLWECKTAAAYEKDTYYGDTLRVRQNRAGGWSAYRDDRELGDCNGPVSFQSAHEAQRLADLHMSDGYLNLGCLADGLSWSGATATKRYRIGDQLGEVVAAAIYAITRALVERCNGDTQTEAHRTAANLLARLYAILGVSRVGSFDTERCGRREAYFLGASSTDRDAALRMSFDDAAQYYGTIALRKRLGADTREAVLRELISWPMHSLARTCDHLSMAV